MNSKDYQKEVLRTLNQDLTPKEQIINMALGLTGEAGEVADLVKKAYYQGHDLPKEKLVNEIGDIAWYLTNLCNCIGVELEDVFQANIAKLSKRYKDGFSAAASVDRVDTEIAEEETILEKDIKTIERLSEYTISKGFKTCQACGGILVKNTKGVYTCFFCVGRAKIRSLQRG